MIPVREAVGLLDLVAKVVQNTKCLDCREIAAYNDNKRIINEIGMKKRKVSMLGKIYR